MSYTYDLRQDYAGFADLTEAQQALGDSINRTARESGADRHTLLVAVDAPAADKAALAALWGGPEAAKEFRP